MTSTRSDGWVAAELARVAASIDAARRPEIWTQRIGLETLTAEANAVERRLAAGERLPLAGLTFAVKDNIDVAGVPTTAGCPAFAYTPAATAPCVGALRDAGAILVGKTNLDQFATGLVGTRSPYGAVRNSVSPLHISGGSSSGSAVAVALGLVDISLGTDTAGSGRVPAALNGVVGMKPTRGLVSNRGVVPACASFDCVSVFAGNVALGELALAVVAGYDPADGRSRAIPPTAPLGLPAIPVVAHAAGDDLAGLDPGRRRQYEAVLAALEGRGSALVPISLAPFLAAGELLYRGSFVAERYAAVGDWLRHHRHDADPIVAEIILSAGRVRASSLARDVSELARLRRAAAELMDGAGASSLVLPTTSFHPTIADVSSDPFGINTRLGTYTSFANLLDYCAVAVPAGTVDGLPFGVSCLGPAWTDLLQADVARIIEVAMPVAGAEPISSAHEGRFPADFPTLAAPRVRLAVAGAHLSGLPLNHELTDRGARRIATTVTAGCYRLYHLATSPPKPGLVRVSSGGVAIEIEIWEMPPVAFANFVAAVPPPMMLGPIVLGNGELVTGFLCEPIAISGADDISDYRGWRPFWESISNPKPG